jgi:hypothetical protein
MTCKLEAINRQFVSQQGQLRACPTLQVNPEQTCRCTNAHAGDKKVNEAIIDSQTNIAATLNPSSVSVHSVSQTLTMPPCKLIHHQPLSVMACSNDIRSTNYGGARITHPTLASAFVFFPLLFQIFCSVRLSTSPLPPLQCSSPS